MLIAYLKVIHSLDAPEDGSGHLKSLIRDQEGKFIEGKRINDNFSPLLSDPQGSFYIYDLQ